jgi:tetratricopeptide (TPR) repeat protein
MPMPSLAQSQPQQGKPTVRRHRVPVAPAADSVYTRALADAETALEKKNYARAESLLKQVVIENDKNYRAWYDLGWLYANTNRKPEAITALRKSIALKSDTFESNADLGTLLASAGQKTQAITYFRKATGLKPSNTGTAAEQLSSVWMSLGWLLVPSSPTDAIAAFREAARLRADDRQYLEPHMAAGQVLLEQRNYAAAEKEYQRILEIRHNFAPALEGLTSALIGQKKFNEAEAVLRRQLTAEPQSAGPHMLLARLHLANERYDEAVAEFAAVLKIAPDNRQAKREMAGAAASGKKYELAEKLYRELAQAEPENAEIRFALGTLLMNQRKFPQAETELIQTVNLDPKLADGYGNLAVVAAENHNYELALKALDARARLVPENPGTYFLRATCYDHLRAFKEASENYRRFLEVAEGKFPTQEWQARHRLIAIEPRK